MNKGNVGMHVTTTCTCLLFSLSLSLFPAMSYPHDDPFHQNNLSTVRAFLDEKHPSGYLVFNLSDHSYDASKLDNHVSYLCYRHVHACSYTAQCQLSTCELDDLYLLNVQYNMTTLTHDAPLCLPSPLSLPFPIGL